MAFGTDSNTVLQVAWWTGAASVALVVLLMIEIVFLRTLLVRRKRRVTRLHEMWQPILVESLERIPEFLPAPPSKADAFEFLLLWNYLQESVRAGDAGEKLAVVARRLDANRQALKMLNQRGLRKKLLAIQTLGWLREISAWEKLHSILGCSDPVLSLCAARSLMRIDTQRALPLILPIIARRSDWSMAVVGAMLKDAGADAISGPLARAVLLIPTVQVPRMLRFLELAHPHATVSAVRQLIGSTSDMETITACLRILQFPDDLPIVRRFLKDGRWQIRLQAAVCLGRIGTPADVSSLSHACGDLEWWVRYRSAQSLANLPFITSEKLDAISESHPNEFASDIIRQVIAEREVTGYA